jgi:hypothetical protein
MHNTIRTTGHFLASFLTIACLLTACGGEHNTDGASSPAVESALPGDASAPGPSQAAINCDKYPIPPGCDGGGDEPPPPAPVTLRLRLRNSTAIARECSDLSIAQTVASGAFVITKVANGGIVDSGGEIVATVSLDYGTSLSGNGGCWRIGQPNVDYTYGSFPITMNGNKDCTIIYDDVDNIITAHMECVNT